MEGSEQYTLGQLHSNQRSGREDRDNRRKCERTMSEPTGERTARDRVSFLRPLRAVRSFRSDPVPQEVVDDVLEVARWSGSASNKQPWEMVLIRDRETLRALAGVEGYAHHLADAPLGIVLVMAGGAPPQKTH